MNIEERFWSKIDKTVESGCWEWTRALRSTGYGAFRLNKETSMLNAHRFAWELTNGAIPDGLYVCHTCDNRKCCNPSHLWLGTPKQNQMDMARKGRTHSYLKRLTDDQVADICRRVAAGELQRVVAAEFGVARTYVSRLASGKRRGAPSSLLTMEHQ